MTSAPDPGISLKGERVANYSFIVAKSSSDLPARHNTKKWFSLPSFYSRGSNPPLPELPPHLLEVSAPDIALYCCRWWLPMVQFGLHLEATARDNPTWAYIDYSGLKEQLRGAPADALDLKQAFSHALDRCRLTAPVIHVNPRGWLARRWLKKCLALPTLPPWQRARQGGAFLWKYTFLP